MNIEVLQVLANNDELPDIFKIIFIVGGIWLWIRFMFKKPKGTTSIPQEPKITFTETSIKTSASNMLELLHELISAITEHQKNYIDTGIRDEKAEDNIHKIQKKLLFELNGPVPVSLAKKYIFEPVLDEQNESTRVSVNHVINTYLKNADEKAEEKQFEMFGKQSEEILKNL